MWKKTSRKKGLAFLLSLAMILTMGFPVMASEGPVTDVKQEAADPVAENEKEAAVAEKTGAVQEITDQAEPAESADTVEKVPAEQPKQSAQKVEKTAARVAMHTLTFKLPKEIGTFGSGLEGVREEGGYLIYERQIEDGGQLNFDTVPIVKNVGYRYPSTGAPDKWKNERTSESYKTTVALGGIRNDYTFLFMAYPDTSADLTVKFVDADGNVIASEMKRSIKYNSSTVLKYEISNYVKGKIEEAGYELPEGTKESYTVKYTKALQIMLDDVEAKIEYTGSNGWQGVYEITVEKQKVTATFTLTEGAFADGSKELRIEGEAGSTQIFEGEVVPPEWRKLVRWQYRDAQSMPHELVMGEDGSFTMPETDTIYTSVFGKVEYTLTYKIVNKLGGSFYATGSSVPGGDKYTKTKHIEQTTSESSLKSSLTVYPNKTGFDARTVWYNEAGEQVEMNLAEVTSVKADRTYYCVIQPKATLTSMTVYFCTEDGQRVSKRTTQNINLNGGLQWKAPVPEGYGLVDETNANIFFRIDDKGSVYANEKMIIDAVNTEYSSDVYSYTVYVKKNATVNVDKLSVDPEHVTYKEKLTLKAHISVQDESDPLQGTVEFRRGEEVLGTATVVKTDSGYEAVFTMEKTEWKPSADPYEITASYIPKEGEFAVAGTSANAEVLVDKRAQKIEAADVSADLSKKEGKVTVANADELVGELSFQVVEGKDIVSVDAKTGKITYKKAGKAVIRVTVSGDEYYESASHDVKVSVTSKEVKPIDQDKKEDGKAAQTGDPYQIEILLLVALLSATVAGKKIREKRAYR